MDTAVTASETATGALYSTTTDSQGRFRLCGLTAGRYQVTAHHSGFADAVSEQSLPGSAAVELELVPYDSGKTAAVDPLSSVPVPTGTSDAGSVESFRVDMAPHASQDLPNAPSTVSRGGPHGAIYGFFGSSVAADLGGSSLLPVSEFGGELTGSFDQNRTSYFVSYDQLAINRAQILSNLAARIGTAGTGLLADSNQLLSSSFAARADHRFSDRDSAYLSYSLDRMKGNSLAAGRDAALPASAKGLNTSQQQLTVANTLNVSPETVNRTSGQFFSTAVELPAGAQTPDVQSALPSRRVLRVMQAADNVYRQVGSQSLRLGGDFIASQMRLTLLENSMGRNPSMTQASRDAGIYVQQERQLRPNLSITAGARYDAQFLSGLHRDLNNFSPQVGIAWSPNSSRTVLRGGFGMDYDRIPLPTLAGSLDPDTPANLSRSVSLSNFGAAAMGSVGNVITVPATIQNAYAEHANFEAEQQLPGRLVLSSRYQFVRGVQLAVPVYRSQSLCATTSACDAGHAFTGQQIGTGATSTYNGVTVALTQTPLHWASYNVAYTYSAAQGAGTGANLAAIEDAMRRFSFTGVLHTSPDAGSTLWQHLSHGFVLSGSSDYISRREFAGLNFINLNARLTKDLMIGQRFRLQAVLQTFSMMTRTTDVFSKAEAAFGGSGAGVLQAYTRVAEVQNPDHTEGGLRLTF